MRIIRGLALAPHAAYTPRVQFRKRVPRMRPHYVIDTGRNGVDDMRQDCSNWCNIRGAGAGQRPTVNTELPELVDAYFWLKTPGNARWGLGEGAVLYRGDR